VGMPQILAFAFLQDAAARRTYPDTSHPPRTP
jgi:hypothetical protein